LHDQPAPAAQEQERPAFTTAEESMVEPKVKGYPPMPEEARLWTAAESVVKE